jgi:Txe/YoeB family toxin of Txe-Axe toxin-antitoxin module
VWQPGTEHVEGLHAGIVDRVGASRRVGAQSRLVYRAPKAGVYYLEAKLLTPARAIVSYRLSLARK